MTMSILPNLYFSIVVLAIIAFVDVLVKFKNAKVLKFFFLLLPFSIGIVGLINSFSAIQFVYFIAFFKAALAISLLNIFSILYFPKFKKWTLYFSFIMLFVILVIMLVNNNFLPRNPILEQLRFISIDKDLNIIITPVVVFVRFTFNGTANNFINLTASKFNTNYTGKTIMVAAKMDPNFGTGLFRALFGCSTGSRNFNFYVYHNGTNYVLHFSAGNSGTFSDPIAIGTGQWMILAATQDATTTTYYLNGVKVGVTPMALAQYATNAEENIGKADNYWLGDIGPVLVYKRCLSESDVKKNYNALKGNFGL